MGKVCGERLAPESGMEGEGWVNIFLLRPKAICSLRLGSNSTHLCSVLFKEFKSEYLLCDSSGN